jgi:hypothetical protein
MYEILLVGQQIQNISVGLNFKGMADKFNIDKINVNAVLKINIIITEPDNITIFYNISTIRNNNKGVI